MQIDDLLRFEWVADPQISPDGTRVAFVRVTVDREADVYRTSLWLAAAPEAGNGEGASVRRLTQGPLDSQPRWSPDGTMLAFVRSAEPKKPGQLHLLPMAGGEPTAITTLERGVSEPAWSPDGRRLVFVSATHPDKDRPDAPKPKHEPARVITRPQFRMNDEGFSDFERGSHLWVVDVAGGSPRQLTNGAFKESSPRWSRDGRWILFLSDRRDEPWFGPEDNDLLAVSPDLEQPTDGAEMKRVADIHGPIQAFTEAPDGRIAAVGGVRPETPRSHEQNDLLVFEGPWPRTRPRVVTAAYDFDVWGDISSDQHPPRGGGAQPLAFTADGQRVITQVTRHGAALLVEIAIRDGAVTELTDAGHEMIAASVTPDGTAVALTLGDVTRPGDLCRFDVETRALRTLWSPNQALIEETPLGAVEEIWVPSFDGTRIHAWIVKPPDFDPAKKYPMILEIHGGPHIAYGVGFFHEFRALAAAGYVVLYANPRGSTSYGQEFANVIQYRYPGDDARDLMACVDAVIARGYVDEKRLGVTGGSGGGLLTNWIVTQTDRFAAAITQRCVADWASMYYSCDFTLFTPTWFRKPPYEDPQEYLERSPATFAAKINTPLMIIHSEEDWRTPIGQGETMFRALLQQRKKAVMVRFPGESHELSRSGVPSRRVQNQLHIRQWFDLHLMGKPITDYDAPASPAVAAGERSAAEPVGAKPGGTALPNG